VRTTRLVPAALVLAAGLGIPAIPAQAHPACSVIQQVTSGTGTGLGGTVVDGDGDRIAFFTNRDLTGGNADGNTEVFLYDADTDAFTQITSSTGATSSPQLSIDDSGTKIAFSSDRDLTGGNPDGNREVFVHDTTGPSLTQITNDPEDGSQLPSISGDGTKVAFRSTADLTGGNADGSREIFLANTSGAPSIQQLTNVATGSVDSPVLNQDGTRLVFDGSANLVPATGNPDGNTEIFLATFPGPTISQLTNTGALVGNGSASISDDGSRVVFASTGNLSGQNADGNFEIFRRSNLGGFTQLTSSTTGANTGPTPTASADRVVFTSGSTDVTGRNTEANAEVLVGDFTGSTGVKDVTDEGVALNSQSTGITDDGSTVVFTSAGDPVGQNANGGNEVFIARCGSAAPSFSDVAFSNPFFGEIEWMTELGVASGFPNGTYRGQDGVKRQQMANFLYNLAGQPDFDPPDTPTFTDYPPGSTFYLQVEWMASEQIASGFPDQTFRPQDIVKRQQMANFLYNLAGQPFFDPPGSPTFVDHPTTATFYGQVEWMAAEQIASGFPDQTFRGQDGVKRQQMANFLHNLMLSPGISV
jgi:Tol biopolymer transport system component